MFVYLFSTTIHYSLFTISGDGLIISMILAAVASINQGLSHRWLWLLTQSSKHCSGWISGGGGVPILRITLWCIHIMSAKLADLNKYI